MVDIDAYVAGLEADIVRLRTRKAMVVEQRARTWSRWGADPHVEMTGRRLADIDRQMNELTRRAAALRKRKAG
jgi:hypothetical protein